MVAFGWEMRPSSVLRQSSLLRLSSVLRLALVVQFATLCYADIAVVSRLRKFS